MAAAEGICRNREGQSGPDKAFKITENSVISVPTANVFPSKSDISVATTCIHLGNSHLILSSLFKYIKSNNEEHI